MDNKPGAHRLVGGIPATPCAFQVARNLCWKKVVEKKVFAVWQKPMNHECITAQASQEQREGTRELTAAQDSPEEGDALQSIPLCTIGSDPDSAW